MHKHEDFESVFAAMARDRPDALIAVTTPLTVRYASQIAEFALKSRLPTMGGRSLAEAGGMMSYGLDLPGEFRRAAHYVNKILKGAEPRDLPIERPTRFELVINMKAAKALGLTIPPLLLLRANQVIE